MCGFHKKVDPRRVKKSALLQKLTKLVECNVEVNVSGEC